MQDKLERYSDRFSPTRKSIIIRIENVSKVYGIGNTEVRALNGVSLVVEQGE